MGVTVIVNKMTVSHKGSSGKSIAFPDLCKTPVPILGVVPIPYPNLAKSSDLSKGSKTVKMDGEKIFLKTSKFSTSTGDEAGVQKGVASSKTKGKGEFVNYSFDVKVDGKNVCRLADPTKQNMGGTPNTAGPLHAQAPKTASAKQLKACEEVKEKEPTDSAGEETTWDKSGVVPDHQPKIQEYVDKEGLIIYFRQTKQENRKWIENKHQPKPHSVTAATTIIMPDKIDKVESWLRRNPGKSKEGYDIESGNEYYTTDAPEYIGLVYSTKEGSDEGRPIKGRGKKYSGKWMTGDYDLFDIQYCGGKCKRPTRKGFASIKRGLNKAMEWNRIQHPPQAWWKPTKKELKKQGVTKGFSMPDMVKGSLNRVDNRTPSVLFQEGRPKMKVIDKPLTVVIAKGPPVELEDVKDVKEALVCCGCAEE